MEKLIPLISDIHDIIRKSEAAAMIDLPIIAVVGSQSTGKSSLLEAIIGREFLPRGRGIVTRRPIEIQLVNSNVEKDYVEFTDRKGEKMESFEAVKKAINEETEKVCGNSKNINSLPIKIRIYSPNVVDLLLVDLPGIVKNPSEGQPEDIEAQVLNMIRQYIKNQNCLIMAVSKANDDLANSQSLKLARTVDPEGARTIGVLTQMDLLDEGVDIFKEFTRLTTPLKLGYVGVYLRTTKKSQQISLDNQYKQEQDYFKRHPIYHKYSGEIGVKYLIKNLNANFIKHIKKTLPQIREQILSILQKKQQQLLAYGKYQSITDKKDQGIFVLDSLQRFVRSYGQLIDGRSIDNLDELVGGARIEYIFSTIFNDSISKMDPFEYLNDSDLRIAIRNANGLRKSLYVAEVAFQNLIKQQISRMLMPSLQCSDLVHEELKRLLFLINMKEMERFEKLKSRIFYVMEDLLKRCLFKTHQMIRNLIEIEMGYINNNHPDFITTLANVKSQSKKNADSDSSSRMDFNYQVDFKKSNRKTKMKTISEVELYNTKLTESFAEYEKVVEQPLESKQNDVLEKYASKHYNYFPRYPLPPVPERITMNSRPKAREQAETQLIKKLIVSYFNVVKKTINDMIPKSIVTFLINQSKNSCEKVLVSSLYKEADFDELLVENQDLLKKRQDLKKTILGLKTCLNEINKVSGKLS